MAASSIDAIATLDGTERVGDVSDNPSLVSAVVGVVDFPGSASLFSLLPFVSISIFDDDSVFSIVGAR